MWFGPLFFVKDLQHRMRISNVGSTVGNPDSADTCFLHHQKKGVKD